jgi:hypothetical protein
MATINLGNIKFNWQGAYAGGTAYAVDDVVSYNGSSYICKLASTGNLPTNNTYWDQMSSAGTNGTNGTDLTTTLTTQGDLVYRDGSGLQRLGAGTAGQVLQSGGAGANPSWTNLSSDFVKIAEHDFAVTNGNGVTFDNIFDYSTYSSYKVIASGISSKPNNTTTCEAYFRTGGASGSDLSGNYGYVKIGAYREWNAVWSNNTADYDQNRTYMTVGAWGGGHSSWAGGAGQGGFDAVITGAQSGVMTALHSQIVGGLYGNVPYFANESLHYCNQSTTEVTGIRFFQGSSYIYTTGRISVYGIK